MEKAMEFIKKNKKYIIWAGCAIMALAVFLTFIKVSAFGQSKSLEFNKLADEYDDAISAYLVLIAAAVSAVLIYLNKEKYSLISTATALVITFYDYFKVKDEIKAVSSFGVKVSYTAPWIVLIGAIVAAAPIVIELIEAKKGISFGSQSTEETKFCSECGAKVKKSAKFCPKCGKECK